MLNHTYTSVKNANLVNCGKTQHIPSQPSSLLKENFLGEFRTELDKKKVLANLGIATSLSLEWEYIQGDIGRSKALMTELDSRTKYVSELDGFQRTLIEGIKYLESVVGGEQEGEDEQNQRLTSLELIAREAVENIEGLKTYLKDTLEVDVNTLKESLAEITEKVNNITNLIQVSNKTGNALRIVSEAELEEGETSGLYVPDLSESVTETATKLVELQTEVSDIKDSLDDFVTKEELGGDGFEFVDQSAFDSFTLSTNNTLSNIRQELDQTVKTGEDGHVDTLYVNKVSKDNDSLNIQITDSFEVTAGIPLDVRFVVKTLEDLHSLKPSVCYAGMGVIVSSQASLYILREPANGIIDEEYINDPQGVNWKCPEDLVTVALSKDEYENLEDINPNIFYYVYEEEIERTNEPKREDYLTEEDFLVAWEAWVNSLKTLSQEYMSASWGIEIENKLGKKASIDSVNVLIKEINAIKGDGDGPSLESLGISIQELQNEDSTLHSKIDSVITNVNTNENKLSEIEIDIDSVKQDINDNYVTKNYIQDSNNDFIFVKQSEYDSYKKLLEKEIITENIKTGSVLLNNVKLKSENNRLQYDDKEIAFDQDIPNITILSQEEYNKIETPDENVYYYTYDSDINLATKNDIQQLNDKILELELKIAKLEATLKTLLPEE